MLVYFLITHLFSTWVLQHLMQSTELGTLIESLTISANFLKSTNSWSKFTWISFWSRRTKILFWGNSPGEFEFLVFEIWNFWVSNYHFIWIISSVSSSNFDELWSLENQKLFFCLWIRIQNQFKMRDSSDSSSRSSNGEIQLKQNNRRSFRNFIRFQSNKPNAQPKCIAQPNLSRLVWQTKRLYTAHAECFRYSRMI